MAVLRIPAAGARAELQGGRVMDTHEPQNRYPVVVEETRRFVVWIEADEPDEAVESFSADPYDPGREAAFGFDWYAHKPDHWDWEALRRPSEHGWGGTEADAHVQTYRNHLAYLKQQADRAACAAAGHPIPEGARGPLTWADYCGTCGTMDP